MLRWVLDKIQICCTASKMFISKKNYRVVDFLNDSQKYSYNITSKNSPSNIIPILYTDVFENEIDNDKMCKHLLPMPLILR